MNQKLLLSTLVVLLFVMAVHNLSHGTPAAEPAADHDKPLCPVAMLDLTRIFKNHKGFAARSDARGKEVEAAEQHVKASHKEYEELMSKLKSLNPGTDDYIELNDKLTRMAKATNAQVDQQKKMFDLQEAAIYLETYDDIQAAVREYVTPRGIRLVLRFNGSPVDRTKPEEVLKELNKSVLYQDGIDITDAILEMVNQK